MELNDGRLSFLREQEVAALPAVHEPVFGQHGGASGMPKDIEVLLDVGSPSE